MRDTESATSCAIRIARSRGLAEVTPDELLLGCLQSLSRFGIARLGAWTFDLEAFGIDWTRREPADGGARVAYSEAAVTIFDRAAGIARIDGSAEVRIEHLLVAFAGEDTGLMGALRRDLRIDSAGWRAAAAELGPATAGTARVSEATQETGAGEYLTPESAAEALGIHVQTLRAYVRSGKLPAMRLAGERALRIRRADLDKVLEPLVPDKQ